MRKLIRKLHNDLKHVKKHYRELQACHRSPPYRVPASTRLR